MASDRLEVIQKVEELQPDLILMDVGLPKLNGIEAARQILKLVPKCKILLLSQNLDPDLARFALREQDYFVIFDPFRLFTRKSRDI